MTLADGEVPNELIILNSQEKLSVFSRLLRLSPLGTKFEPSTQKIESPKEPDLFQTYYGVYIPCESKIGPDEEILPVYKEKLDALKIVKKYKKARFKAFKNHHDAVAFALQGIEPTSDRDISHNSDGMLGSDIGPGQSNPNFVSGEKPSQFKGPKPQDMVAFRRLIEAGDFETVKKTVWDNPRYLVSSGDTPSILQEGSRYNALHVAVKAQNVQICDYLLSTISDPQFIQLLYGDDNYNSCKERASILLDLYLNTPDRAMNETPLHFAVKFGAKDVADLLVSYPQCNKYRTNKFGEQPKDIICQRSINDSKIVSEIAAMLQESFYVPVLHSEDDSKQPIIGEPFSPGSPLPVNPDVVSPRMEIRAFAGPMNMAEAHTFRKKWKTPPRSLMNKTHLAEARFRLQDVKKGLETVGRNLAQQMKIGWKEYWPFLDTFTDLTSIEGLLLLEDYLKNKFTSQWNSSSNESFTESLQMTPKTPVEKFKELCTTGDASDKSPTKSPLSPMSPMSDLCVALKSLTMNNVSQKSSPNFNRFRKYSDSKCNKVALEDDVNTFLNPGLNPHLCVEKSCQVFAKRLGLGFTHALTAENEFIAECLKSEIKHLQQTVSSYLDDPRFQTVDFQLLHSRVAQLVAQKLRFDNQFSDDSEVLVKELIEISLTNVKNGDAYSSDEEDVNLPYRQHSKKFDKTRKKNKDVSSQIKCLANYILKWITAKNIDQSYKTLKTEEECVDIWSSLHKCNCSWQTEQFIRNSRKNASIKRNHIKNKEDLLSSSPKSTVESVSKRLLFEENETSDCVLLEKDLSSLNGDKNHNFSNGITVSEAKLTEKQLDDVETDSHSSDEVFRDIFSSDDEVKSDDDVFHTPLLSDSDNEESDYEDADDATNSERDVQSVYVFILGDKPTKTDKAVYDAVCNCDIDVTKYPYVYRWRHTVSLYTQQERESWPTTHPTSVDLDSPITCSFNIGYIPNCGTSTPTQKPLRGVYTVSVEGNPSPNLSRQNGSVINPITLLTPTKNSLNSLKNQTWMGSPKPSMQVSKWMRVTGPNSPRSALINRNYGPNVSLGF